MHFVVKILLQLTIQIFDFGPSIRSFPFFLHWVILLIPSLMNAWSTPTPWPERGRRTRLVQAITTSSDAADGQKITEPLRPA